MFQVAFICEPVCARADTLVEETPWTGPSKNCNAEAIRCDDNETLTRHLIMNAFPIKIPSTSSLCLCPESGAPDSAIDASLRSTTLPADRKDVDGRNNSCHDDFPGSQGEDID